MKIYQVNHRIHQLSLLLLLLWFFSAAAFVYLLVIRSHYWLYSFFGITFLIQWLIAVISYPKKVIVFNNIIVFVMFGGSMIQTDIEHLKVSSVKTAYSIEATKGEVKRNLRLAKKVLSVEISSMLDTIA